MLARERRQLARGKGNDKDGGKTSLSLVRHAKRAVWDLVTNQREEVAKLVIPSALYALQNTLLVSFFCSSKGSFP